MPSFDERRAGAIAHWLGERKCEDVRFEVEPGKEQVLEEPEQRELGRGSLAAGAAARGLERPSKGDTAPAPTLEDRRACPRGGSRESLVP